MRAFRNLMPFGLALCVISIVSAPGKENDSKNQLQVDTFGTSTLQGVKKVYPQVLLEVIERNAKEPGFVPKLGSLTQKDLAEGLTQALKTADIEIADDFDISLPEVPLNLNITVFIREAGKASSPAYIVSVNTEALQQVRLSQNDSIRTLARTWPMTPTGLNTRNLLLLNPKTLDKEVKKEVAYQLRFFIKDFFAANPKKAGNIKETRKEEIIAKTPVSQQEGEQMITGTVLHIPIEGGFYGLLADDGTKYDPLNLPPDYEKNGLRVKFQISRKTQMASIHMWGTIVQIEKIENL
ncbi:MAG: hypothetical protein JW715_10485 [Sedimentisphaerales bacterium]|nr:hypothetical protein [Sedimentisphaerales bacterium]